MMRGATRLHHEVTHRLVRQEARQLSPIQAAAVDHTPLAIGDPYFKHRHGKVDCHSRSMMCHRTPPVVVFAFTVAVDSTMIYETNREESIPSLAFEKYSSCPSCSSCWFCQR